MAEMTKDVPNGADYIEDEFGIGLKAFLGVRFVFYVIGIFMILGAIVCMATGITNMDNLVSSATGLSATAVDANFDSYKVMMFVQAGYTIVSAAAVALLYIKRAKLYAIIDAGLFVVLIALLFVTGCGNLLLNGSAWLLYFLLNPIISFVALFVGKHFDYMPLK